MLFLFACGLLAQCLSTHASLPSLNINMSATTVSGFDGGAYFATQFHVARSDIVQGAALFGGGPYYCAQGHDYNTATTCAKVPELISASSLANSALHFQLKGEIEDTGNMKDDRVYIFHGSKDGKVDKGCSTKAKDFYKKFSATITTSIGVEPCGHGFPTQAYGNACGKSKSPYLNNCQFNGAFKALSAIIPNVTSYGTASQFSLFSFDQKPYHSSKSSLGDEGFVYVPVACQNISNQCNLHVTFHGCDQTIQDVGTQYVKQSGLNDVAEVNNLVVLYPQVRKSTVSPINEDGCWDWWGYTEEDIPFVGAEKYATKSAKQTVAVYDMISNLSLGAMHLEPYYA